MKKTMYILITGLLAVVLTACGSNEESKNSNKEAKTETTQNEQQKQEEQMKEMQKKLEAQKVEDNKTVAVVNDKEILGSDYNALLSSSQMQFQQMGQDPTSKEAAKQVKEQTIDSLVGQTLLLQEADKKGYKASEDEVKKQLDETKKNFKSDKEFKDAMKKAGLDMNKLETQIADNIKYTQYVEKEIPVDEVTDEEIQTYYDQVSKQGESSGQKPPKLEEIKPQIKQQLEQQKKQEKLTKQVEELKKGAKIDIKI
ncbi:SurA N-terminal domain-containing protein [Metabacillus arenae]|uniref:SurA N-terminal domain-containing protein n=1 Tax=Metabacillus arenae TaxID=2771434 RepID=A0A926NEP7_9BACI|nr:SurA N-terminal domain-containing protein [Metabacillus arenae]MBD1382852.1 SurA N-terminal domain-containing protein [Metabacillus arenae]